MLGKLNNENAKTVTTIDLEYNHKNMSKNRSYHDNSNQ